MEALQLVISGFGHVFEPTNLLYLLVGVLYGNLVGVLPGLGPLQGSALIIPLTFKLQPETAIIMLCGIYYGAMYGGSTTSILLNIPGESSSVMTAVEGYPLNLQGRAGPALGMSAISSFICGTVSVVLMMFLSLPMANMALEFGPAETFAVILCALTLTASLGGDSVLKGLIMGAFGVTLATIGPDPIKSATRLTFGIEDLIQGVNFVSVALGLFALPEVFLAMERPTVQLFKKTSLKLRNLLPTVQDFKDCRTSIPQGFLTGFIVGVMPGAGAVFASFITYGIQRKIAVKPELFGKGSMEAIGAVEGANNAAATSALIPMLTFGIPGSGTAAVIMGAMIIHGLRPGPLLFQANPEVAWSIVASMYLGNVLLLILNLPLIGIWVSFMRTPQNIIFALITALAVTGAYSTENSMGDVFVMFVFGIFGYILRKANFPAAPVLLAIVLTEQLEAGLRQALMYSNGNFSIFITSRISLVLLIIAAISIVIQTPIFAKWAGQIRRMVTQGEV